MTPSLKADTVSSIPAFKECSLKTLQRICAEGKFERFQIGGVLSTEAIIPSRILIILKGKARLLGKNKGKLSTLALFGPGNLIGLCSLLRAQGCEEVSAATLIEAWSIPDTLIAEIYSSEKSFREWCENYVFPAEGVKLLEAILNNSHQSPYELLEILNKALPEITSNSATINALNTDNPNIEAYIASANSDKQIDSVISDKKDIASENSTFNVRILGIPVSL